jgi:DNA-binding NtrC family response regulator
MREDTMDRRSASAVAEPETAVDLRSRVRAYERGLMVSALEATGGNQRRAAAMLGLLPTTCHEKLKRHGLRPRPGDGEGEPDDDEA